MRLQCFGSLYFTLLFFHLSQLSLASVLAIDYGNDFIKASLMKPGIPFDVLLNKDSKRKISTVVAFKKGERLFGQDAYNLVRFIIYRDIYQPYPGYNRHRDTLLIHFHR